MKSTRFIIFTILLFICASLVYSQTEKIRDVPITEELSNFIDCFYNNELHTLAKAKALYSDCITSIPEVFDEYQKAVHLARCYFYFGMYTMGEYDFDSVQNIKSMTDTSDNQKNLSEQAKQRKEKAASYFDRAIDLADKALKIRSGSDAYLIKTMALSSNCTVKNTGYVIRNGLSVGSLAKKAINKDELNATAHYYQYAQDLYAPAFFANYKNGLKKMKEFNASTTLRKEKFDHYFFITGMAYGYYKLNDKANALKCYKEALKIYPGNHFAIKMVNELSE